MRVLSLIIISSFLLPSMAAADQCQGTLCIDVTTENNQDVLITVKRDGSTSSTTSTHQQSVRPRPRLSVWIPWLPQATISTSPRPRTSRIPRPKPTPSMTTVSTRGLMDQVRSAIPSGLISFQPKEGILIREPVYFRTTVPEQFTATVMVLEIPIQISMQAKYIWNFGDGEIQSTTDQGAPFPLSLIRHAYQSIGMQHVSLRIEWTGTWRSGAVSGPIRGAIVQNFATELQVLPARARITR